MAVVLSTIAISLGENLQTFNALFEHKARELIAAQIEEIKDDMTHGMDHDAYIRTVGRIAGLRLALELMDETHKRLMNV